MKWNTWKKEGAERLEDEVAKTQLEKSWQSSEVPSDWEGRNITLIVQKAKEFSFLCSFPTPEIITNYRYKAPWIIYFHTRRWSYVHVDFLNALLVAVKILILP